MSEFRADAKTGKILALLAPCAALVGLDSLITVPLIPDIVRDTAVPSDLRVLLVTAYALTYALSAPVFGAISDRSGRKRMICFGALVLGVGTALTGLGAGLGSLLLFRATTGVGAGALMPGIYAYVGDKVPYEKRGRAMGALQASFGSATVLGLPLGAYLAKLNSWRWPFWLIGLLALLTFAGVGLLLPKDCPQSETVGSPVLSVLGRFRTALFTPSVFFALLTTFLWYGGLQGMFANLGVFYARSFDLDTTQIGAIIAAAGLFVVVGSALGGRLADRLGKRVLVVSAGVLVAASVLGFSLTPLMGSVVASVVLILWGLVFGAGQAALIALISEPAPGSRGTVLSLNSSFQLAGSTVFTAVSAALLGIGEFAYVGILSAAASLLKEQEAATGPSEADGPSGKAAVENRPGLISPAQEIARERERAGRRRPALSRSYRRSLSPCCPRSEEVAVMER